MLLVLATMAQTIKHTIAADNDYKIIQKAQILSKISEYADKYDVPYSKIYNLVNCETDGTFNPEIQSRVKYNFSSKKRGIVKGTYERSYGLAQIHLPDHPSISRKQATDIDYSLDFMAETLSRGENIWYCKV